MPAEDLTVLDYSTTTRAYSVVGPDGQLEKASTTIQFQQLEQSRTLVLIWVTRQLPESAREIVLPEIVVNIRALQPNRLKAYALFKLVSGAKVAP